MPRELFRRLIVAAGLVVCVPICTCGADGSASGDQQISPLFVESSLSATTNVDFPADSWAKFPALSVLADAPSCQTDLHAAPCPSPYLIAGVEATFFRASASGIGVGSALTALPHPTDAESVSSCETFYTFSPRIYVGVQDDCWAVLSRFWYLSDSSEELLPPESAAGSYTFDRLKAYTVDLEASRDFCLGRSKVSFFGGARYASFEAGEDQFALRLTSPIEIVSTSAVTNFSFNGLGVSTGFLGITPISTNSDSRINLVWSVRGSVMWGDCERGAQTMTSFSDVIGSTSLNSADDTNHDVAFILEARLGVQWEHELQCLPMSAFLRVAAEYQYWDLGDNGQAESASFAVSPTRSAVSAGFVGDVNAQFVGFSLATGFRW